MSSTPAPTDVSTTPAPVSRKKKLMSASKAFLKSLSEVDNLNEFKTFAKTGKNGAILLGILGCCLVLLLLLTGSGGDRVIYLRGG